MANLLDECVADALRAARIVGASKSYATDNKFESKNVFAYLNGGPRPQVVATAMGEMLVGLEDARRQNYGPPSGPIESDAEYTEGLYASGVYSK